jgi:BRCT domain type II-containing protein
MTHYVVLGSNVGALKLAAIEQRGLKMLNERTSR